MSGTKLHVEGLEARNLLAADAINTLADQSLPRVLGDANSDGVFDTLDLIQVAQAGKYLTGEAADWTEGDWNLDGRFNERDFVVALQAGPVEAVFGKVLAARRGTDRPLKGTMSGSVNFLPTELCPIITTVSETSGNISHLGKVDAHLEHCPPIIEPFYTNGHAVFTAANGDQLEAEYGGDFGSPFILDVIGGSGRFEDATGTIILDVVAEGEFDENGIPINPWTVEMELSGTISY